MSRTPLGSGSKEVEEALRAAIESNDAEGARSLLAGCVPEERRRLLAAKSKAGAPPLCDASSRGHAAVVRALLSSTSDEEEKSLLLAMPGRRSYTPLHYASNCSSTGHVQVVKELLATSSSQAERSRLLTMKNAGGSTPLHCAAWCGNLAVVEELLAAASNEDERGELVTMGKFGGATAEDVARESEKWDVVRFFEERRAAKTRVAREEELAAQVEALRRAKEIAEEKAREAEKKAQELQMALQAKGSVVPHAKTVPASAAAAPAATTPSSLLGRLQPTSETDIDPILPMKWERLEPTQSLLEELLGNDRIRQVVPEVDEIVDEIKLKLRQLAFVPEAVKLTAEMDESCLAAVLAYTHDLCTGKKDGNLYYELNKNLRGRGCAARAASKERWGTVAHYLLKALSKLPTFKGTVWRGMPDKGPIIQDYQLCRPIQWGAFSSTSRSKEEAKSFGAEGAILKIKVTCGTELGPISFFPKEGEVLLPPTSRFTVASEPYEEDGITVVEMVQQAGNPFVS